MKESANGKINEVSNSQPLCTACHGDRCSNEHGSWEYVKIIDAESSFNYHIQSVIDTPLDQTHTFIETIAHPNIERD